MIPIFVDAAVRSLLVGLAVAAGLRIFRVRNVLAQKTAWGLVLVSALAMPLLLPVTAQWHPLPTQVNVVLPAHPMTLLQELQARIVAKGGSSAKPSTAAAAPNAQSDPPSLQESPVPDQAAAPRSTKTPPASSNASHAVKPDRSPSSSADPIAYSAGPVRESQLAALVQHINVSPTTVILSVYCGIAALFLIRLVLGVFTTFRLWRLASPIPEHQLPSGAASFPVRSSNQISSPITLGSGILLPADYKNWESEKLRIVLAHEASHVRQGDFYLQLLAAVYAAFVWFSPLGWWLKHALAELAEAISDRAGIEEAASRTSYAQVLLEFAATPRRITIGVAMARPGSLSRRIERLLNDNSFRQCFAGGRRALIAVMLVPVALVASTTLVHVQAAVSPAFLAGPQLNSGQSGPAIAAAQPATGAVLAFSSESVTSSSQDRSELIAAASPSPAIAEGGMQEGEVLSFDRTLSVSGNAQLDISTGSGNIHITHGSGSEIKIHGKIHVHREGSEDQARQIAANPPIEQDGNTVRVGQHQDHQEQWHGISIDYDVEAPAGIGLDATSGSGNVVDEGVGQNAKLQTGSGDISATGLEGPFTVKTGSGNISATQTGQGDVVAETGSGDIELKDIHGGFRGETGSGDIKASGTPSASWNLQTGSGNIELWTGNAPLTLDASTGSGSVATDHEMMVQGTFDRHHIHGNLNGGGPTLRLQTGSGDVRIH